MKNILTKKAMTLFELLAVIVILGIILAIGFPTVNRLIDNSRKDAFAANVNSYISAAKTDALTEWAATSSAVNRVYHIGEQPEYNYNRQDGEPDLEFVKENFGLNGFSAGAVHVKVKDDGSIESITLVEAFEDKDKRFKTKSSLDLTKPITRAHVEDLKN